MTLFNERNMAAHALDFSVRLSKFKLCVLPSVFVRALCDYGLTESAPKNKLFLSLVSHIPKSIPAEDWKGANLQYKALWLLAKPVGASVIIGARRLDQLQDNLASVELGLTEDEITLLDKVSALPPEYPGWMLPVQSAGRLGELDDRVWDKFQQ